MLRYRAIFHSINSKFFLIGIVATLGSLGLLCTGFLSIEALILIWNFAFVASVMIWERYRRSNAINMGATFSNDERWSKIKRDLECVDGKLQKTKDSAKIKSLLYQKRSLENELRRVEWSIKETNMNEIYNAGMGNLRKLDSKRMSLGSDQDSSGTSGGKEDLDPNDKFGPEGALRERRQLERQAEERKNLERIIDNAERVLCSERAESLPVALQSVANDFKAHYNVIKRRKYSSVSLADYWVAWALISSVMNGVDVDLQISKYASKEFRPRIFKFIKSIQSLHLATMPRAEGGLTDGHSEELELESVAQEGTADLNRGEKKDGN